MDKGIFTLDWSNNSLKTTEPAPKKAKLDRSQPQFGVNSSKGNKTNTPGKEEPFVYLSADHPDLALVRKFFDLSPHFPTTDLFVRNATGEPLRAIYITNSLVRNVLNRNPTLRLLNAGTRLFVKQPDPKSEAECLWRIHSDGLSLIDPFLGDRRVIDASVDDIWELLKDGAQFPLIRNLKPNLRDRISKISTGGFVIRVDPSSSEATDMNVPFSMPMWKSPQAVKYVPLLRSKLTVAL
jgi:multisite-specific tRNA:(cytosine-C5)-methyltransferase